MIAELETDRLLLRKWIEQDLAILAVLNSDPEVMKYLPALLSREESKAMAEKCKSLISERGWGFWAVEQKSSGKFIGFVGLHTSKSNLPFSPCVEIGWRLLKDCWGKGYATEAAQEALVFAFNTLKLKEVVSFTAISNSRSRSVMDRLGFSNTHQNFEHPGLKKSHLLSAHVLYKITKQEWRENGL